MATAAQLRDAHKKRLQRLVTDLARPMTVNFRIKSCARWQHIGGKKMLAR